MGDLRRKVLLCALSPDGTRGKCREYTALIDTGATRAVVPKRILRELGTEALPDFTARLDGGRAPVALLSVRLAAPRCGERAAVAIVSDRYARKASKADLILGHDYLQAEHVGLLFSPTRHRVAGAPPRRNGRRR